MQLWQRDELRRWISTYIEQDQFRQLLFINAPFCFALTMPNLPVGCFLVCFFFQNRQQSTIIELKQKTSTHLSHPLLLQVVEANLVHFPSYWQNYPANKLTNSVILVKEVNPGHALCETVSSNFQSTLIFICLGKQVF